MLVNIALAIATLLSSSSEFNMEKYKSPMNIFESPFDSDILPLLPKPINMLQEHGTTTMSFIYKNSVIVTVDSMASIGSYVGSRNVKKVFPVSEHAVATMAGGVGAFFLRA